MSKFNATITTYQLMSYMGRDKNVFCKNVLLVENYGNYPIIGDD